MGVRSVSLSVQLHSPRARRTSRDTDTETDRGAMAAAVCPPGLPWGAKYYTDVGGVCTRDSSFFGGKPVLNQGVGYAVVLGFGAIFAVVTSFLVSSKNTRLKPLSKFLAQTCLLAKEKNKISKFCLESESYSKSKHLISSFAVFLNLTIFLSCCAPGVTTQKTGVVGEEVRPFQTQFRVVQHCRPKHQDWTHCQCHCFSG